MGAFLLFLELPFMPKHGFTRFTLQQNAEILNRIPAFFVKSTFCAKAEDVVVAEAILSKYGKNGEITSTIYNLSGKIRVDAAGKKRYHAICYKL